VAAGGPSKRPRSTPSNVSNSTVKLLGPYFRDPEGNVFGIAQRIRQAQPPRPSA